MRKFAEREKYQGHKKFKCEPNQALVIIDLCHVKFDVHSSKGKQVIDKSGGQTE